MHAQIAINRIPSWSFNCSVWLSSHLQICIANVFVELFIFFRELSDALLHFNFHGNTLR